MDKINFDSLEPPVNIYNCKMNNNVSTEVTNKTLNEAKSKNIKFDWLEADKLIEFIQKKTIFNMLLTESHGIMSKETIKKIRNDKIAEEQKHIAKPTSKRTEYNNAQLRSSGVGSGKTYKYLTANGHINSEGKKILKEHKKRGK